MSCVDVSALGDVNLDLILARVSALPELGKEVLAQERILRIGGSAANLACACARLGLTTRLFGKIGRDHFGAFAEAQLQECGVLTDGIVQVDGGHTGITCAFSMGERGFITHAGEIATLDESDVDMDLLFEASHLHVAGCFLTSALRPALPAILREAKRRGLTTSFDTGWDPQDAWLGVSEVLDHVDVFLPNEAEITRIAATPDMAEAERRMSQRVPLLALKLGQEGSAALEGGRVERVPAFDVPVLDTTAAGDAFNAGFLWGRLHCADLRDCLTLGNACGAMRIATPGGPDRMPDLSGLARFLADRGASVEALSAQLP